MAKSISNKFKKSKMMHNYARENNNKIGKALKNNNEQYKLKGNEP